jgi:hypothetical protein
MNAPQRSGRSKRAKARACKEGNWLATPAGNGYFAILRLYAPTEAAINQSWKPGDIEKLK